VGYAVRGVGDLGLHGTFSWIKRVGDAKGKVMTNEKLCAVHLLMLGGSGPYVAYFYCPGF